MQAFCNDPSARGLMRPAAYLLTCLGVCLWATSAPAQEAPPAPNALIAAAEPDANGYLVLPLPKPGPGETLGAFESRKNQVKTKVMNALRAELPLGENLLLVDRYFNNFEFRTLTQSTPEALEALPKARFDFFKYYIFVCKNQETHQEMIKLTFAMMQQIAMNNFHPVVRYNAMIMIGDLNEQEVLRVGATPLLPEPYAAAIPFMVDRISDPKTPDPVRIAALVGLIRHLEWEPFRAPEKPIPAGTRTTMLSTLIKLAETKDPPAGRTVVGQQWLRRRAIEALGLAGAVTAQPNAIATIEKVLKDTSEPTSVRCAAALALGRMNVPANHKIDANELARILAQLATSSVVGEFDRLAKMDSIEKEHQAVYARLGTGIGGGGEGYGGGVGGGQVPGVDGGFGGAGQFQGEDPKAYRLDAVRKRLRYHLYCVQTGLGHPLDKAGTPPNPANRKGVQRLATVPAERKTAEEMLAGVNRLADLVEKNKIDLWQLENDMRAESKSLAGAIARAIPAPAAAPANPGAPGQPAPMGVAPTVKPAAGDEDLLGGAAPGKK
ncbi:hypothetical protein ETAA8_14140 [Anatilimnocola aggregata]|uniref:HEAT repeat domain-containing protein n=1 Tax=Anatilimnocola aggregata TaxID=2528021 RepID=A0A517Y7Y7_9BACT|nr:HEAT repeat domain-containing protein [Anatilimnocola aggregata]QDU26336.1 hypothetical protein ETAA8_14140 [Anatilimnocola aggregata]